MEARQAQQMQTKQIPQTSKKKKENKRNAVQTSNYNTSAKNLQVMFLVELSHADLEKSNWIVPSSDWS